MDFLQEMHDAVYFKYSGKRYYLKNGVHYDFPISPALFDIYMDVVMEVVRKRCPGFAIWYKL